VQESPRQGAVSSFDVACVADPSQPTLEELCAAARRDVLARLGLSSQQPLSASTLTLTEQTLVSEPALGLLHDAAPAPEVKADDLLPLVGGHSGPPLPAARRRSRENDNPPPVEELCAAARRDVLARLGFVGRIPPPLPSKSQQLSSSDGVEWSCGESLASSLS
jgi:hypothetical protein